jgi:glycosyltransferase involved in cell wall biosynthesis
MKISCVIVSYNNGHLLREAITSVVRQSYPIDEIIVADDASTDGSRDLISSFAREYPTIRPIFRTRNLGVSANRDLAIREAIGDLITTLDGDDFFLPEKIEAEVLTLRQFSAPIAFSDVRIIDHRTGTDSVESISSFSELSRSERVRWLLSHGSHNPQGMLFRKEIHDAIGGYRHGFRTYEDWDYKIRFVAEDCEWTHSGVVGVVIRRHRHGLSAAPPWRHTTDRLRVVTSNRQLLRKHVGAGFLCRVAGRIALSGAKWSTLTLYWQAVRRIRRRRFRYRDSA